MRRIRSRRTAVGVAVAGLACAVYAWSVIGAFAGPTSGSAFADQYRSPNLGNSTNAKLCQQGGWQRVLGADGTRFVSQADCVAYGSKGGEVIVNQALQDCESSGGTYSTDPATNQLGFGTLLWTCLDYQTPPPPTDPLGYDCTNLPWLGAFGPIYPERPRQTASCVK